MNRSGWILLTLFACFLSSCESSSNNTTPATPVNSQSSEPFAVIELTRVPVSPFEPDLMAHLTYIGPNTNDITLEQVAEAGDFDFEAFEAAYEFVEQENVGLDPNSTEFAEKITDVLKLDTTNRN